MKIAVTGSIATDHLMHFPGRFADQLIADQLHKVSLSFLVDDLVVRRGGVAAEHRLRDGAARACARSWSARSAPTSPTTAPGWSATASTATRCTSARSRTPPASSAPPTTDMCQIASFYAGAMSEARNIELAPVADRARRPRPGRWSAPNDPEAMLRHTAGVPRPRVRRSSPTRRSSSPGWPARTSRTLIDGAAYLITNDYEKALLREQDRADRRRRCSTGSRSGSPRWASTACEITGRGIDPIHVPIAREIQAYDPTGVGDGFRAGFFAALSWGLRPGARRPGRLAARHAGAGDRRHPGVRGAAGRPFVKRLAESYGDDARRRGPAHLLPAVRRRRRVRRPSCSRPATS